MKHLNAFWRRSFLVAVALLASAIASHAQQVFPSPTAAVDSLIAAVRSEDLRKIQTILGPGARDIVSSGDKVADKTAREEFLAAYDETHAVDTKDDKAAVLVLGKGRWPFPIPLVRQSDSWRFNTAAGRIEILHRRIGRNELNAIETCFAYVEAQNEYAEFAAKEFGRAEFAQRVVSTVGKRDGLYWPATSERDLSPLGELFAVATEEGYAPGRYRIPYHGYYYKIIKRQGPNAPGGTLDYVSKGKMTGGFALVAWPSDYGNSGVKTFLINQLGVLYEKDLGVTTARTVGRMFYFNPDQTWERYSAN